MPELPEVEVIRRSLFPHLVGRRFSRVVTSNRRLRLPVPRAGLKRWIQGNKIETLDRRSKYLLVTMDNGALMVLHLGMSGRLALVANGIPRAAHDHLRFQLDNGLELRFSDVRRFGSVRVLSPEGVEGAFAGLGPEPLAPDFSSTYLREQARGRVRPIKNFLMDGRIVAGIGNIYANEILFAAGIRPHRSVGELEHEKWDALVRACRQVLEQAIECGGTTISDFVNSHGEAGYFQCHLNVYGRGGERCGYCTSRIVRQVLAGRATYFCPACQR
ncbi:MAG: bifunctional DNA-formamidopyrimidine glycosylase/DNA-(apurinic or apyrimidinic site) lyase [Syntrophobacteria bacterium]